MKYLFLTVFALVGASISAFAGTSNGEVTIVYARAGDVVFFSAGSHPNKPACSNAADEWAFSLSTPAGKAMFATLLAAQAQGLGIAPSALKAQHQRKDENKQDHP